MNAPRPLGRVPTIGLVALLLAGIVPAALDLLTLFLYLSYAAIGVVLARMRPANAIGWLLIAIAFGFVGTTTTPDLDVSALAAGTASLGDAISAWFAAWAGTATFLGFFVLVVIFPSGRLPDGRWRIPSIALISFGLLAVLVTATAPMIPITAGDTAQSAIVPNPFAVLPDLPIWRALPTSDVLIFPVILLLVVGVATIVVRYRRASGVLRLQLRWLAAAVTFMVLGVLAGLTLLALFDTAIGGLAWIPVILAYPTIPIAISVAVLRYRLLEIDRIVSRTIAYTLVTGILAIVFAAAILLLQGLLSTFTQGQTVAVAASTLAVFALFQPVRRRVQRLVDRRFDRGRYDSERTALAFSERLRHEVDMEAVTLDLAQTTRQTVAPTSLAIWLRRKVDAR